MQSYAEKAQLRNSFAQGDEVGDRQVSITGTRLGARNANVQMAIEAGKRAGRARKRKNKRPHAEEPAAGQGQVARVQKGE